MRERENLPRPTSIGAKRQQHNGSPIDIMIAAHRTAPAHRNSRCEQITDRMTPRLSQRASRLETEWWTRAIA